MEGVIVHLGDAEGSRVALEELERQADAQERSAHALERIADQLERIGDSLQRRQATRTFSGGRP